MRSINLCYQPFDSTSPFYQEIPTWARTNTYWEAQGIASQILDWAALKYPEITTRRDGLVGEPTYYTDGTGLPTFEINCDDSRDPFFSGVPCAAEMSNSVIGLPSWARPENNRPPNIREDGGVIDPADGGFWDFNDGHMTVIDKSSNLEFDLWQVWDVPLPPGPSPATLNVSWANFIDLQSDGLYEADVSPPPSGVPGIGRNATAGYFASTIGRIRLEELQAGEINHALFLVVNCQRSLVDAAGNPTGVGEVVYPSHGTPAKLCEPAENTFAPALGA